MEFRTFDKLKIETSLLGFGCMRFPTTTEGTIDEKAAQEMLDKAIAAGVNYIDTAYPYHNGESEPFVGRALKKYDRNSFYLATKLPVWDVKEPEDAKKIFEKQLERLQTDYIDFYLLHALNRDRFKQVLDMGILDYCLEQQKAGKIKYLGFSFHDSYEAFEEIINYRDWDFCQIQYNYMDTEKDPGDKGYKLAEEKQVPLVIMEPIKGGTLANFADDITSMFHEIDKEASAASYALRWVGSHPGVKVILSGMSNMAQVEDNLHTFEKFVPLSERESETIDKVVEILKSRVQNGCTGCRYCMPCPAGVNIPGCFSTWNTYHMYQNYNTVRWSWETGIGEAAQAKNCIKCGKCEAQCPQKISIREDLEKVQSDLDKKEMIL